MCNMKTKVDVEYEINVKKYKWLHIANTHIMEFFKGENKIEAIFKELTEAFPEVNKHVSFNWEETIRSEQNKNKSTLK